MQYPQVQNDTQILVQMKSNFHLNPFLIYISADLVISYNFAA